MLHAVFIYLNNAAIFLSSVSVDEDDSDGDAEFTFGAGSHYGDDEGEDYGAFRRDKNNRRPRTQLPFGYTFPVSQVLFIEEEDETLLRIHDSEWGFSNFEFNNNGRRGSYDNDNDSTGKDGAEAPVHYFVQIGNRSDKAVEIPGDVGREVVESRNLRRDPGW